MKKEEALSWGKKRALPIYGGNGFS